MFIKEISLKNGGYFVRDTIKENKNNKATQKEYDKNVMRYYTDNKKAKLLDFVILKSKTV